MTNIKALDKLREVVRCGHGHGFSSAKAYYEVLDGCIAEIEREHAQRVAELNGAVCERDEPMCVREEIVRCRDCKHYEYAEVHRFDGARRREPTCARLTGCAVETQPDRFCWWGERRER